MNAYAEQPTYPQPHPYNDEFNPYSGARVQARDHFYYDGYSEPRYDDGHARLPALNDATPKKTTHALRNYRYEHHGGLWTKGGRGVCMGRFCCCTIVNVVLLFITVVLALALWVSPPNIVIGGVNPVQENGSTIQLMENGITVNLGVNISVKNPNYFAVNFREIEAQIFYPINNTEIGSGIAHNVVFHSHSTTDWTFPFTINYTTTLDPGFVILSDLAQKCGILGEKSNLSVNYRISLGLRILFITVSPAIKNTFNFPCPIDAADLESLMKNVGLNLGSLPRSLRP